MVLNAGLFCTAQSAQQSSKEQSRVPPPQSQQDVAAPNLHVVSVTFNYDFRKNLACSPNTTAKTCIKEFNVYDISGGRYKLFSIPVPAGAHGQVKGITGQGPLRAFEPGMHFIAVTAESVNGVESDPASCKTTVQIPASVPTSVRSDDFNPGARPAKR